MKDVEVQSPPDDTVSKIEFSPATIPQTFLVAGSWDHNVRCWQIEQNGTTIPKAQQTAQGPVMDVCWSGDGSKVFTACGDKMARMWDLGSNQYVQVAAHDAPGSKSFVALKRVFHGVLGVVHGPLILVGYI
jgi:mRNA export factor